MHVKVFLCAVVLWWSSTISDALWLQPDSIPQNGEIAFVSNRDGNRHIYVMESDGSNVRQLTFGDSSDAYPDWSPDGTRLVFQSFRDGAYGLYIMNADGTGLRKLVDDSKYPAWSPDGDRIAFMHSMTEDRGTDICTIDVDGGNLKAVTTDEIERFNFWPTWSPDGQKILYVSIDSNVLDQSMSNMIFWFKTVDVTTGEQTTLYSNGTESFPDWSWVQSENEIVYADDSYHGNVIRRIQADGSSLFVETVTEDLDPTGDKSRDDQYPSWSPDGSSIVFNSYTDTDGFDHDIFVINVDTGVLTNLTPNNTSDDIMPDWQPRLASMRE